MVGINQVSGSEPSQRTGVNILREEVSIQSLKDSVPTGKPDKLRSFEIIFIKEGGGILSVDSRKYLVRNNIFFCLAPGQYRLLETSGSTIGYRISFSLEFYLLADAQVNYYNTEWISSSSSESAELLTRMREELSLRDSASSEVVRSLFRVFMIYLRRSAEIKNDFLERAGNDKLVTHRFFTLLRQHYVSKKLVSEYADELCITPNYLNAVVKKQTGYPASHHIQQFIVMEAKRQAVYSGLRMKEVADLLGFEDCAHFSKFFKNYSGMNFTTFRRSFG